VLHSPLDYTTIERMRRRSISRALARSPPPPIAHLAVRDNNGRMGFLCPDREHPRGSDFGFNEITTATRAARVQPTPREHNANSTAAMPK
jgi:hypothetical protein